MKPSFLALWMLYLAAVANDLFVVSQTTGFETLLYVLTFGLLGYTIVYLLSLYGLAGVGRLFRRNWHLFLYLACLVTVQLTFHGVWGARGLRLAGYTGTAVLGYMLLPAILMSDERLLIRWFKVVAYTSAAMAMFAILGSLGLNSVLGVTLGNKISYSYWGIRASGGLLEHPLHMGAQAVIGIGAVLFLREYYRTRRYLTLLYMCVGGLFVSMARGAWLGTLIGAGIYVAWLRPVRHPWRRLALVLTALFVLGGAGYMVAGQVDAARSVLRLDQGLSSREVMWPFAAVLILREPIRGYGFGSPSWLKAEYGGELMENISPTAGFHNILLNTAAESGVIVAALYMLVLGIPIIRLLRSKGDERLSRALLFAACGMIVASMFVSFNVGGLRSTSLGFAVCLGLANVIPSGTTRRDPR